MHSLHSIVVIVLLFNTNSINCFTITNSNIINFTQQLNFSSEGKTEWLLKAAFPSYIQEFLKLSHFPGATEASTHRQNEDLQKFLENLLKEVTSYSCRVHVTEWFWRILPTNWKDIGSEKHKWVMQMVDSWGKLPEGILSGHVNAYGDYDECIQISVKDLEILNDISPPEDNAQVEKNFEGQYCPLYFADYTVAMLIIERFIHISNVDKQTIQESVSGDEFWRLLPTLEPDAFPSVSICTPTSCSRSEIQHIFQNSFNMTYTALFPPNVNFTLLPWPVVGRCSRAEKPPLSTAAIAMIALLAFLGTLSLVTGVIDYWLESIGKNMITSPPTLSSTAFKFFMAFSPYTNIKSLLSTRKTSENFGCLHGIRFLSIVWVILAHTYDWFIRGPQWNRIDLTNAYKKWTILAVLNGTFSVDTLFVTSGLLVTYNTLTMLDKNEGKFNILMYYIHKYVRFTPTYAILLGIAATLYTYLGNGPQWYYMELFEKQCQENWWKNILYINNLVDADSMCHKESWYLANDMQFYILLPFFVYPIWKWEFMGVLLLFIYTVFSCITPVLVTRYASNPPAMINTPSVGNLEIYVHPWSRISTFLVGVWLGGLLYKINTIRFRIPFLINIACWLLAAFIGTVVIFAIKPWFDNTHEIPRVAGYFYAGLSRLCWALVISWVIFACVRGYGGVINKFLSWKVFIPLGRLSFCVYLVSYHVQSIFHLRLSEPIKWDECTLTNLFFSHLVMSYLIGFFCSLLLEWPFVAMQKMIFEGKRREEKESVESNQTNC